MRQGVKAPWRVSALSPVKIRTNANGERKLVAEERKRTQIRTSKSVLCLQLVDQRTHLILAGLWIYPGPFLGLTPQALRCRPAAAGFEPKVASKIKRFGILPNER